VVVAGLIGRRLDPVTGDERDARRVGRRVPVHESIKSTWCPVKRESVVPSGRQAADLARQGIDFHNLVIDFLNSREY